MPFTLEAVSTSVAVKRWNQKCWEVSFSPCTSVAIEKRLSYLPWFSPPSPRRHWEVIFLFVNSVCTCRSKHACISQVLCHCEQNKYHLELIDQVVTRRVLPVSVDLPVPRVARRIFQAVKKNCQYLKWSEQKTLASSHCFGFMCTFPRRGGKMCVWHFCRLYLSILLVFTHFYVCVKLLPTLCYCAIMPPNNC